MADGEKLLRDYLMHEAIAMRVVRNIVNDTLYRLKWVYGISFRFTPIHSHQRTQLKVGLKCLFASNTFSDQ